MCVVTVEGDIGGMLTVQLTMCAPVCTTSSGRRYATGAMGSPCFQCMGYMLRTPTPLLLLLLLVVVLLLVVALLLALCR